MHFYVHGSLYGLQRCHDLYYLRSWLLSSKWYRYVFDRFQEVHLASRVELSPIAPHALAGLILLSALAVLLMRIGIKLKVLILV